MRLIGTLHKDSFCFRILEKAERGGGAGGGFGFLSQAAGGGLARVDSVQHCGQIKDRLLFGRAV